MLFNSLSFLIFFPLVTTIYFALPHRFRWAHLLLASCVFYAASVPVYLLILFGVILIDYWAGRLIAESHGRKRRALLAVSLLANVGILAAFKYFNFLNGNLRAIFELVHLHYPVRDIGWVLPLGLSFHTFQSMSYTIEVFRGKQAPERHLGIYALYVMFFPQLVAGPIERPQHLLHQFREYHAFDADRIFRGLRLMLWGFVKKLVIADRVAPLVDAVYGNPHAYGGGWLITATWFFAVQIYCDFSGYSDIAVGAARVLGFGLVENFERPYLAASVSEFWHRWHISLSTWFRDYLYIPLGGSRVSMGRWCANIVVVFLISGLWHGAKWTFVAWGLLHALYMIASRSTSGTVMSMGSRFRRIVGVVCTFNLVSLAWVFFRADTLADAFWIVSHLVRQPFLMRPLPDGLWLGIEPFSFRNIQIALIGCAAMAAIEWGFRRHGGARWEAQPRWVRWPAYYAAVIAILAVGDLGTRTFIYFQF